jgi:hypothetical protein
MTVTHSKGWRVKSGQPLNPIGGWACVCGAGYKAGFGVIVEVRSRLVINGIFFLLQGRGAQ